MAVVKRALVVVESPTKVKTIQKYLDSKYVVKASMGHVRDLPKSKLGVDEKKGFKPEYKVLPAKKKVLDELKKAAEKVDALYIATDPDREGEAIGWHLAQELGISKAKTHRIMFNEITERAVKAAFLHPGKIDTNKVNAQQARRVLDRLVGYKLSPAPLGEDPPRALGRSRAVGGGAPDHRARARDRRLRAGGVLVAARQAQGQEPARLRRDPQGSARREGRPARRGRHHRGDDRARTARPGP